jgi:MFS family permease
VASSSLDGPTPGLLDASPMTKGQILAVGVGVLLAALDGFDVLGMALVAPALDHAWHLDRATLGLLLSTSLMGMALGSIFLSPLADAAGRKPVVLGGVSLMVVGSLLSALCHSVAALAACRIVTGLGIGVMVPLTTTIASEFASGRRRAFAVSATTAGFTAGSVIGSLVASFLLKHGTWPAVFVSGAVAGVILLPAVTFGLPESPAYLLSRRGAKALERLNRVLSSLGRSPVSRLPPEPPIKRASYTALFGPNLIGVILSFAAVMVLVSTSSYYLLNWLPQLVADSGFPPSTGGLASAASSLTGAISGLLFGLAANRFGAARLASIAMIGLGCAVAAFGFMPPVLALLLISSSAVGFFSGGSAGLFYATMAARLPVLSRTSGIGFVLGIGRVFSIAGPALGGWMFATGVSRADVCMIFGIAPIVGGLLLFAVTRRGPTPVRTTAANA